jgi:hypothetical protein
MSIPTSLANVLERQWRLNTWLTKYVLGTGPTPNDFCSVPMQNHIEVISGDVNGQLKDTEEAYDVSCIPANSQGEKVVTFNILSHISKSVNTNIYISFAEYTTENNSEIKINIQYNGIFITHGTIHPGQIRFLKIKDGIPVSVLD